MQTHIQDHKGIYIHIHTLLSLTLFLFQITTSIDIKILWRILIGFKMYSQAYTVCKIPKQTLFSIFEYIKNFSKRLLLYDIKMICTNQKQ